MGAIRTTFWDARGICWEMRKSLRGVVSYHRDNVQVPQAWFDEARANRLKVEVKRPETPLPTMADYRKHYPRG